MWEALADEYEGVFIETSVFENVNVKVALEAIVLEIINKFR